MGKKIYIFYLNNYIGIHHIITLILFITMFTISGMAHLLKLFPFQIFILVCNYFVAKFTLRITRLPQYIEEELKNIQSKDNK